MKMRCMRLLSLIMLVSLLATCFSYAATKETSSVSQEMKGFSYNISGEHLDKVLRYSIATTFEERIDYALLSINDISENLINQDVTRLSKNERTMLNHPLEVKLKKVYENVYTAELSNNVSINLTVEEGKIKLLDFIVGEMVYAFGSNRLQAVENECRKIKNEMLSEENENTITDNKQLNATGKNTLINSKTSEYIYMAASWNPKEGDNRIGIRIQTRKNQAVTFLNKVQLTGRVYHIINADTVNRRVKSVNPTGPNTSSDWSAFVHWLISINPINISIPSFPSNNSYGTWNENTFTFNFAGINAQWNSMQSTANVNGTKGLAFHVYVENKNTLLLPKLNGTVKLYQYVSTVGSFTRSMNYSF